MQQRGTADQESLQQEQGSRVLLSNRENGKLYGTNRARMSRETTQIGYTRKQKGDASVGTSQNSYVDRGTLSNIITDMAVQLPDVTDAATMVTDDEVFVAYRANTTNRKLVADQVYKTAASVVPRYYHIYVSPEQKLMTQMEGLKSGKLNNTEYVQTVEMLKRQMVKTSDINLRNRDNREDLDNMMD
ncbi:YhcN/YlaJ family sporulation lipoprotein [Ectobacillus sp. SYSU M60031]|uniref:YhcN/YlaJ family sporulation lipoprotein n=1 Tax=Ectobacillus ponti TaxID=2961894 RepID=A0AA41XA70_9BACI|nr:YhcN/YlaJ family sporulation lipoprotein [Ectobacillus ponti]MCP8969755.1 YhcN/YlaJ family sporulation lipoprotein [Ectobacillus ponti]